MPNRKIVFPSDRYGYIWTQEGEYVYLEVDDVKVKKMYLRDLISAWNRADTSSLNSDLDTGELPNVVRWFNIDKRQFIVEKRPTNFLPWTLWSIILNDDNSLAHARVHALEHTLSYPTQAVYGLPYANVLVDTDIAELPDVKDLKVGPALSEWLNVLLPVVEAMGDVDYGSQVESMKQPIDKIDGYNFESLYADLSAIDHLQVAEVDDDAELPLFKVLAGIIETHGVEVDT